MTPDAAFSETELRFLRAPDRSLGRVATVGRDGIPHVVPSGWVFNDDLGTIDVTGREVQETKKFRDVARTGKACLGPVISKHNPTKRYRPRLPNDHRCSQGQFGKLQPDIVRYTDVAVGDRLSDGAGVIGSLDRDEIGVVTQVRGEHVGASRGS